MQADLKEVEERPKLGHVVLEWCSRQQQPVSRSELLHLLEEPGFGVFQTVALVHDDVAPLAGLEGQQERKIDQFYAFCGYPRPLARIYEVKAQVN